MEWLVLRPANACYIWNDEGRQMQKRLYSKDLACGLYVLLVQQKRSVWALKLLPAHRSTVFLGKLTG